MIRVALIQPSRADTEIDQRAVAPSAAQIFDGIGGIAIDLRQKQYLFFRHGHDRRKGRRYRRQIPHDGFDRLQKGHFFDLDEIVQRRIAADSTGKPAPFAVGDLQAVVLTSAIDFAAETNSSCGS